MLMKSRWSTSRSYDSKTQYSHSSTACSVVMWSTNTRVNDSTWSVRSFSRKLHRSTFYGNLQKLTTRTGRIWANILVCGEQLPIGFQVFRNLETSRNHWKPVHKLLMGPLPWSRAYTNNSWMSTITSSSINPKYRFTFEWMRAGVEFLRSCHGYTFFRIILVINIKFKLQVVNRLNSLIHNFTCLLQKFPQWYSTPVYMCRHLRFSYLSPHWHATPRGNLNESQHLYY